MLRLEEVLKTHGKSQIWLADKLGIGKSAMNNLVKGRSNPSLPKVYRIAQILECSVYDLITPNDYPSILTSGEAPTAHGSELVTAAKVETNTKDIAAIKEEIKAIKNQLN